jgi:hypothetical protein
VEGKNVDSDRFDGLVRSFGPARSRRQTLRGLAGAGALLALPTAKPAAAGTAGKPDPPKNPGKGQPGNKQSGAGQNGQLGGGPNGQPGSSPGCQAPCLERFEGCGEACGGNPVCFARCEDQRSGCLARCPTG